MPAALTLGQAAEAQALQSLRLTKNTEVWRPSPAQVVSPDFEQIVGPAHYTATGLVRGTVLDSVVPELAEIKAGSSVLDSSYQLRLQTYRAVIEGRPLTIYTSRPVGPDFRHWLAPHGVEIKPLPPEPEP